jgi:hypothetical protein
MFRSHKGSMGFAALAFSLLAACGGEGDTLTEDPLAKARGNVPALSTLQVGQFREIAQTLKVNVVFVGFPASSIDSARFTGAMPASYQPVARYPSFYGLNEPTGNRFNFDYNVVRATATYEDALFAQMSAMAQPRARTTLQNAYNLQPGAAKVGANHAIDAASMEAWLAANPPGGVDTRNYTMYFINWYGRPDFKFHVYEKTDYADPDTGFNHGLRRSSRRMIAWGGTPSMSDTTAKRVWFYDFSAGPESWTANFDIVTPDLDGDGVVDYRIPAFWDYGNTRGYRPFNDLTGDAARLARYVGINLLFTSSPLYNPAISAPKLPSNINVDMSFYQGDVTSDALASIKPDLVTQALQGLQAHNTFSADVTSLAFTGQIAENYLCFFTDQSCFGNRFGLANTGFGSLYLYHQSHLNQYLEFNTDYEVPVFGYNLADNLTSGLLGFADDDYRSGTQSQVFTFTSPAARSAGFGFTLTTTHEVGHHLGMSHPHDGRDSETGVDYGPSGPFAFAWSGDESHSVMHYLSLVENFGQFDRDNMDRWKTAAYINQANAVLAQMDKSPRAGEQALALRAADSLATSALGQYQAMNYRNAVREAKSAYVRVLAAAAAINVQVEPQAKQADYRAKGRSPKFVDPLDDRRLAE